MDKRFVLRVTDGPYLLKLKTWSPKQYEVLTYLRDHPENTYAMISKQLNVPVNTIKTRLYRARMKIMEYRIADLLKQKLEDVDVE